MEIRHRAFCQRLTVDRLLILLVLLLHTRPVCQSANNRGTRSDASKTHALHSLSHVTPSLSLTRGVLPAAAQKKNDFHPPAKSHHAPVSCLLLLLPLALHHFSGRNGALVEKLNSNQSRRKFHFRIFTSFLPSLHILLSPPLHVWHTIQFTSWPFP